VAAHLVLFEAGGADAVGRVEAQPAVGAVGADVEVAHDAQVPAAEADQQVHR
jgi:hypothetical protein